MYRLVVVDDNPLDRNGILNTVDWEGMGIQVVASYSNGRQVIENVEKDNPHILLSDIAMPVMNGIEMVRILRNRGLDIKTIFMSCHDEFDFAKSAVNLDVESYVLKPIVAEELREAIEKVLDKRRSQELINNEKAEMLSFIQRSLPLFTDQFFRELVIGSLTEPEDIRQRGEFLKINPPADSLVQVAFLRLSGNSSTKGQGDIKNSYLDMCAVLKLFKEYAGEAIRIHTVQLALTDYVVVAILSPNSTQNRESLLLECVVSVKDRLKEEYGLSAAIGLSLESDQGYGEVNVLFKQARLALESRFYSDEDRIVAYAEIADRELQPFEEQVNLQDLYSELKELLLEGNEGRVEAFIGKYLAAMDRGFSESYVKSFAFSVANILQILLIENHESFSNVFGDDIMIWSKLSQFNTIRDIRRWLFNIVNSVVGYLHSGSKGQYARMVEDIKTLVKKRYHEQLTVNDIAKALYLSLSHANNIFKKMEDKTIFDYLLECRMEAAMRLLRDPDSRVYAVSEQVGYSNKSHFCLVFKKTTGLSPMEYKNKYTGKEAG